MDTLTLYYPLAKIFPLLNKCASNTFILTPDFLFENLLPESDNTAVAFNGEENTVDISDTMTSFQKTRNICICMLKSLGTKYLAKIKCHMDMLFFSVLLFELEKSRSFRYNVLKTFYKYSIANFKELPGQLAKCPLCDETLWLIQVNIYLTESRKSVIDYKWNKKLEVLINERCELEHAMAWLSTLGGAFSALGDYFVDCAEKAGLISMQQLRLALRIGDPITISQCKIYLAMSLLQRGYFSKTKYLIRELYAFAISPEGSKDFRLKNVCIAVWNKLKYNLSEKKRRKQRLTS